MRARLNICGIVVLILGMALALGIYFLAEEDNSANEIGYVVAEGTAYPIAPNQSKRYIRDLERFGGKAAVLFDEINRWFAGLWRGKALGVTVGWISTLAALAMFLFARWLPPDDGKG